jgi:hypothetical protein
MRLARALSPRAVERLGELMESDDERVAAVACNSILDRAHGRPKLVERDDKDAFTTQLESMTPQQRIDLARRLIQEGREYLPAYREWKASIEAKEEGSEEPTESETND